MVNIDLEYRPRKWQRVCHDDRARFRVIALHRRGGKALDVDTLIPMASGGFKRMGDLVGGDRVFDERGIECNVVCAHEVMYGRECFEIKFSDGGSIIADGEHLWHTDTKLDRTHRSGRKLVKGKMLSGVLQKKIGKIKTTKEILDTLYYCGEHNHSIPVAGSLEFNSVDLDIPPYILGAWLGDGTSLAPHITSMDSEVISAFMDYAKLIGATFSETKHQNSGKAKTYRISWGDKFRTKLSGLELIGNKHIPEKYFCSSVEQRRELLRGLMDTDGSIDKDKPCCEITQKNRSLALGVMRLVRSLGMMASMNEKVVKGISYWRVSFRANYNCFTISRKAERYSNAKRIKNRFIVDIIPVRSRPVRCITVDSQSKLYLASEWLIPTHNTVYATMELIDAALKCREDLGLFVFVAPFLSQAKSIAWGMIKFRLRELVRLGAAHVNEAELTITFKSNGAKIKLFGGDNPDALRGVRLDGAVLDEVAQMKPEIWSDIIQPALSDRKGWAIFIGTPNGINMFSEKYYKAKTLEGWSSHLYTVYDTDAIEKEEVERLRRDMSEASFEREYMCNFAVSGEDQLISMDEVETASNRVLRVGECDYAPKIIGVDIARFGSDSSVIQKRQGFQLFEPIEFRGLDNMEMANQVIYHINAWQPDAVFLDAGGGSGVIDRVRQLGHSVIEVPFGGKSGDPKCSNKRSEMFCNLRDWLRAGGSIPNHIRLKQDLATPRFWYDKFNRIILEPKDDIKARGLPSTDFADAAALTFAQPVVPRNRVLVKEKQEHEYNYEPLSLDAARGRGN